MKKLVYAIVTLLEIALAAGAYIVHYFTRKKMGMLRYVIYKNQSWERDYPIETLRMTVIAVLILLTVTAVFIMIRRRKSARKSEIVMTAATVLLTAAYAVFTLGSSAEDFRAYYFMSSLLALASLLQVIKVFIVFWVRRHEK